MDTQVVPMKEVIQGFPKWVRICVGAFLSAVASYYITQIVLICMGQSSAPLFDLIGPAIAVVPLLIVSGIAVAFRKPLLVNLMFAVVGLAYIIFSLRFASGQELAVVRQYVFYSLPFLINGFLLSRWLVFSEEEGYKKVPPA